MSASIAGAARVEIEETDGLLKLHQAFLFNVISKSKQLQLENYMQMIYHHQPAPLYQLHQQHPHSSSIRSTSGARYSPAAAVSMQPSYDYNSFPLHIKPQVVARLQRHVPQQQQQQVNSANMPDNGFSGALNKQHQYNHHLNQHKLINLKLEGVESSLPPGSVLHSMMRNLNQQLLLEGEGEGAINTNHRQQSAASANSPTPLTTLAGSSAAAAAMLGSSGLSNAGGAPEEALLAGNIIESLDIDPADPAAQYEYPSANYQVRDQRLLASPASSSTAANQQLHTMSAMNNNSLALYRLLNFIDQSVAAAPPPPSSMSMPFQSLKTFNNFPFTSAGGSLLASSLPASLPAASRSAKLHSGSSSNNANINNNMNINNNHHNKRHQPLASQSTAATSIPNYLNNWSRKRNQQQNQLYWKQHNQSLGAGGGAFPSAHQFQSQAQTQFQNLNNQNLNLNLNLNQQQQQQQLSQPHQKAPKAASQTASSSNNLNNSEKLNGALTLSTSTSNSKVPHDADSEIIAANNAPRCDKFTPDICVDDFEYPEQAIIDEIQKKRDVFELMYSEVKDNEPLVDGIPRDVEESYNYDYYYYNRSNHQQPLSQAASQVSPQQQQQQQQLGILGARPAPLASRGVRAVPSKQLGAFKAHSSSSSLLSAATGTGSWGLSSGSASLADVSSGDLAGISAPIHNASQSSGSSSLTSSSSSSGVDGMDALIGAFSPIASPSSASLSAQSPPSTGFICPSEVMYGKPKLAKNKKGLWKVIVNAGEFTQTVRLEKCLLPNKKCNYVEALSYESRCAQVHSYHRLLVFEKGRGFYIDTFRLPTGCNCHVTRREDSPFTANAAASSSSSPVGASVHNRHQQPGSALDYAPYAPSPNSSPAAYPTLGPAQVYPNSSPSRVSSLNGYQSSVTNDQSSSSAKYGLRNSGRHSPPTESMLGQTLWSILSGGANSNAGLIGSSMNQLRTSSNQTQQHQHQMHLPAFHTTSTNHYQQQQQQQQQPMEERNALYAPFSKHASSNGNNMDDMSAAQREAYHSQSAILEHLSQNPRLAEKISDSVLKQLIDVSGGAHLL